MSKPVKSLIQKVYTKRFGDLNEALLIDIRGVEALDNNKLRNDLATKQIKVTVVKNTLARNTFKGTELDGLTSMISGPTALVTGGQSVVNVARELIAWAKKLDKIQIKGAILDGTVFGPDQIDALSKYPTREEAQAQVIQLILSPAGKLVSGIKGPGSKLASILKTIEEKLEKGEAIVKAA